MVGGLDGSSDANRRLCRCVARFDAGPAPMTATRA
jgi:hypothetical protein